MNKAIKSKIKLLVVIAIAGAFVWVFILSPMITFKSNEKRLEDAARRYYELNSNLLPTGERVGTVTLGTLYNKSYIDKDIYIPLTNPLKKKTCSVTNSWVKVRKENNEYKYYTYLECGIMNSSIDHKGPTIKLNGDTEMSIGIGEEYKELGVKSVSDNKDGKMNVSDVKIKGKVDTSTVGTYEITYTAKDDLSNTTEVVRTVSVVQKLNSLVKKKTGDDKNYYVGANPNNYVYFSNMVFRIVGLEGDDVKIVADKDIANVNYDGIDKWFDYYEDNLTDNAKKYIKSSKYCNMKVSENEYNASKCNSYGNKSKIGLLSIDEINRVGQGYGNYLVGKTITWLSNPQSKNSSVTFRMGVTGADNNYAAYNNKYNFGVRPVMVIDGDILVSDGNGTESKPYKLEDYIKAKTNIAVNERYVGEYINYGGITWRISSIENDGTVRVISEQSLIKNNEYYRFDYETTSSSKIYNPKQKGNPGYVINNKASEFFNTKYAVQHEIEVPIYKSVPNYGKEVETKKYKVKVSAPNMYEMFSAFTDNEYIHSYWLVNSSKDVNIKSSVSDIGVVLFENNTTNYDFGIRPVIYLNKNCRITSGYGTKQKPFVINK